MSKNQQHYRGPKPAKSLDELGEMLKDVNIDPSKESVKVEQEYIPAKTITRVVFAGEVVYTSSRPDYNGQPQDDVVVAAMSKQIKDLVERCYSKDDPYASFMEHVTHVETPEGDDLVPLLVLQHMRDKGPELTFARLATPWGATSTVDKDIVDSLKPGDTCWSYLSDGISTITVAKSQSIADPGYFIALKVYSPGSMKYKVWTYGDLSVIGEMANEAKIHYDGLPELEPSLLKKLLNLF